MNTMRGFNLTADQAFDAASRLLTTGAIVIGCIVVLGWLLDWSVVMQPAGGATSVKINTAISVVLLGVGMLVLSCPARNTHAGRLYIQIACLSVIALSGASLSEWMFNIDLGIDQILRADPQTLAPGRMAPNTSIALLAYACTLLLSLSEQKRTRQLCVVLNSVVFAIALAALCSYLYHVETLRRVASTTDMAFLTSLAIGMLALARAAYGRDEPPRVLLQSPTAAGFLTRWLLPTALFLPIALGAIFFAVLQTGAVDGRVLLGTFVVIMSTLMTVLSYGLGLLTAAREASDKEHLRQISELNNWLRLQLNNLEFTNQELTAAQTKAETADRLRGNFFAHVSHELRTPLAAILGAVDLLAGKKLDPECGEFVLVIRNSAQSLLLLINNMLDVATCTGSDTTQEPYNPRALVDSVIAECAVALPELNVKLWVAPQVPLRIQGEGAKVRCILVNLMYCAAELSSEAHVEVFLSLGTTRGDNETLYTLEVSGWNTDQQRLQDLLAVLLSADSSFGLAPKHHLVLAISKRLAQTMDGDVTAEAIERDGVRLILRIPMHSAAAALPMAAQSEASSKKTMPLNGLSILLVEDDPVVQRILSKQLQKAGLKVEAVSEGRQALHALKADAFDVMLTDINLPDISGINITRILRRFERRSASSKRIPVVAITASTQKGDREKCMQVGIDEYLTKPVSSERLLATLGRVLKVPAVYSAAYAITPQSVSANIPL